MAVLQLSEPYILLKYLNRYGDQDDAKKLTDDHNAGGSQQLFDEVEGLKADKNDDQVDDDADKDIVMVIACLEGHYGGEGAGAGNKGKGYGYQAARLTPCLAFEKLDTQDHFHTQEKDDDGTCDGKRGNIEAHEPEHLPPGEEEQQHEGAGHQGGLQAVDPAHLFFKPYQHRNGAENIDHRKKGQGNGNDLGEHYVFDTVHGASLNCWNLRQR